MEAQVVLIHQEYLQEAVNDFLMTLAPGSTREGYKSDLARFISFLSSNGYSNPHIDEIGTDIICKYRDQEHERVKSSSLRRYLCSLRSFFGWAAKNGYVGNNPAASVPLPKKQQSHPVVLSVHEIERLLSAPDTRTAMGQRDRALLSVCYYCGLRVSELCSLSLGDIRWEHFKHAKKLRPGVVVEGKGGKVRAVPLADPALEDLKAWLEVRPEVGNDALFLLRDGRPMTIADFRYLIEKYSGQAGLDKPITPHTLRHSFATHLARGNVRLDLISEYLGHSDMATTRIYLHLADEDYAAGVDALPAMKHSGMRMF